MLGIRRQKALPKDAFLPDPNDWGWKNTLEGHDIIWTTLPDASKSCQELTKCGCKSEISCKERCKCVKASLKCTALCNCRGDCERIRTMHIVLLHEHILKTDRFILMFYSAIYLRTIEHV